MLPVGTVVPSRKTSTVSFIVVRRGESGLGQWLDERRDVGGDHLEVFREAATSLPVAALSIDTNDTRSTARGPVQAHRAAGAVIEAGEGGA